MRQRETQDRKMTINSLHIAVLWICASSDAAFAVVAPIADVNDAVCVCMCLGVLEIVTFGDRY